MALGFIWEGIGQFMARNHHYRYLFGTVSISRDYTNLSRALIVSYLKAHEMEPVLVNEVRAYNPPRKADLKKVGIMHPPSGAGRRPRGCPNWSLI